MANHPNYVNAKYINVSPQKKLQQPLTPIARQRGVVLFIAMIALLVMSLASVALIRSVNTNTDITGNLGFKRATTASADIGTEAAVAWLFENRGKAILNLNIPANGYIAKAPTGGASVGTAFWNLYTVAPTSIVPCNIPMTAGICNASESIDAAGNRTAFIVQRLCADTGSNQDPLTACARDPSAASDGQDMGGESVLTPISSATYYRILVRVVGPRNTTSYVQTIVSM
ncbi:MAG: hypothetical protein WBP13_03585 [Methylophilaceae bacterium]